MLEIIPAILPKTYSEIEMKVAHVVGHAPWVQIDFCDGKFVQNKTWPFNQQDEDVYDAILKEKQALPFWQDINYELDLMVTNAHKKFDEYIALGVGRLVFHLEAEDETFLSFLENLDPFFKEQFDIGIALSLDTDVDKLQPYIPHIKFIQCMGIETIGVQGSLFSEKTIEKIKQIKNNYHLPVSVDGGVSEQAIKMLLKEGTDRFVVGSTIFNTSDPLVSLQKLQEIS